MLDARFELQVNFLPLTTAFHRFIANKGLLTIYDGKHNHNDRDASGLMEGAQNSTQMILVVVVSGEVKRVVPLKILVSLRSESLLSIKYL